MAEGALAKILGVAKGKKEILSVKKKKKSRGGRERFLGERKERRKTFGKERLQLQGPSGAGGEKARPQPHPFLGGPRSFSERRTAFVGGLGKSPEYKKGMEARQLGSRRRRKLKKREGNPDVLREVGSPGGGIGGIDDGWQTGKTGGGASTTANAGGGSRRATILAKEGWLSRGGGGLTKKNSQGGGKSISRG